jgi:hypothetical protein
MKSSPCASFPLSSLLRGSQRFIDVRVETEGSGVENSLVDGKWLRPVESSHSSRTSGRFGHSQIARFPVGDPRSRQFDDWGRGRSNREAYLTGALEP